MGHTLWVGLVGAVLAISEGGCGGPDEPTTCAEDCSRLATAACMTSVCNTGQLGGPTGACVVVPAADGAGCAPDDQCLVDGVCTAGACASTTPKDCTAFTVGCHPGVCDAATGACSEASVATGTCTTYLAQGFEVCDNGWTLAGDWQCGVPANVGPSAAFAGARCLATQLAGPYSADQRFAAAVADSPPIDLGAATSPRLGFWAWTDTEGGSADGWNVSVSTDRGQTFTPIPTVAPAFNLMIAGQPAWGGHHAGDGWQRYAADLSAYTRKTITLRFAFDSDSAVEAPGVYIDRLSIAEPVDDPLAVTTSMLATAYAGAPYLATLDHAGGSPAATWIITATSTNAAWLTIDPATGALSGTPAAANVGAVSITVRVAEPTAPANASERTFAFAVRGPAYATSFEGACPDGWTLTGDWQCGVPVNVGPATAYDGTQCIATQVAGSYSNNQPWVGTTATSPAIVLAADPTQFVTFRMWLDTEGLTYDGVNLGVSSDGGLTYQLVTGVMPAYSLTIAGQAAWGGHQAGLGWQLFTGDLSAYANQTIRLRFAFNADSSGTFPGAYIDDVRVY